MKKLSKVFLSFTEKIWINLGKGKEQKNKGVIVFSHGRAATPFLYSTYLKNLARDWKILAPQHSEASRTPH